MKRPFEQAVTQHGAVVLRVCRAALGPDEADDAWSETFLSALRAWPDLPDDTDVRAWLVTVAHRKAVDVHRSRVRRAVPVEAVPEVRGLRRDEPEAALPDAALWQALAALPPRQRQCVAYHHVAGLPHPEVARIVGGTAAAARRASADGIAALRRTYATATGPGTSTGPPLGPQTEPTPDATAAPTTTPRPAPTREKVSSDA